MVLENEKYLVTIHAEPKASLEAYTVLYQKENLNMDDFYMARLINIEARGGQTHRIALLDQICSSYEPCAVLKNDILTVILFETILRIDLNTRTIVQCVDCENMGGLEKIHPINEGYIIKGEGDIFRYDNALNRIWHFSGRDIFVSPEGDDSFWFDGNEIHCRDWEGWHYILDMNRKMICEYHEKSKTDDTLDIQKNKLIITQKRKI